MSETTPLLQVRVRAGLRLAIRKHAQAHPEVTFREIIEDALERYLVQHGACLDAAHHRPVRLVPGRRRRRQRLDPDLVCIIDDPEPALEAETKAVSSVGGGGSSASAGEIAA